MPHMSLTIRASRTGGKGKIAVEREIAATPDGRLRFPGDFSLPVMSSPESIEQKSASSSDNFPLSADGVVLDRDDSLIEVGVIDSTGVLELIGFIEERYEVEIADEESSENLDSIAAIIRFVGERPLEWQRRLSR